jgi:hypothetical protein
MSRLTEIQKAIEELAPRKKRNFASGSTNLILSQREWAKVAKDDSVG